MGAATNPGTAAPGSTRRGREQLLLVLSVLLALAAGAGLIAVHHLKRPLARVLAARTGHPIRIDGPLEVHLFARHPSAAAEHVTVGNPPWTSPGELAHLGRVVVTLRWQFCPTPLGIARLEIDDAALNLRQDPSGHANWHLRASGPGQGPPLMQSLAMPGARVKLQDERHHLKFSGTVSVNEAPQAAGPPRLRIAGAGALNGRPASFTLDGDPLAQARRDRPYHFLAEEHSAGSRVEGRGELERPFDLGVLHASYEATGPDLSALYYLVGLRLPQTGAYQLTGKLDREGARFRYSDLRVTTGKSDLSGDLTLDSSGGRPMIHGQLRAATLRLADLGAHAAGKALGAAASDLRIPDNALPVTAMQRADAAVQLEVGTLELGAVSASALTAQVALEHGVLSISRLQGSFADGRLFGHARLDASLPRPRGDLDLSLSGARLDELDRAPDGTAPFDGSLSGRVQLSGEGMSLHQLAATANGRISAVVPRGAMRASLAQRTSLELAGALGLLGKRAAETGIRCGAANIEAHEGVLTVRTFELDTQNVLISGGGNVHLDGETLELSLRGRPKHVTLAVHSGLAVTGTLAHPQVRLAGHEALAQAGAAVALGTILTPVAAVLAFVNPGLARDADCAALLAEVEAVRRNSGGPPPPARRSP